jgi:hypothetical protein
MSATDCACREAGGISAISPGAQFNAPAQPIIATGFDLRSEMLQWPRLDLATKVAYFSLTAVAFLFVWMLLTGIHP